MCKETMLQFVLGRLDACRGKHREVAANSGVPYSTVKKIACRITPNPGVNHVQTLSDYFKSKKAA